MKAKTKMEQGVSLFNRVAGYPVNEKLVDLEKFLTDEIILPNGEMISGKEYLTRRASWMFEECREFENAVGTGNLAGVADAVADLLYFALGTTLALGIDIDAVFDLVQKANMKKFTRCSRCNGKGHIVGSEGMEQCPDCRGYCLIATYRESDGKLEKPEGWTSPDIATEMERQATL